MDYKQELKQQIDYLFKDAPTSHAVYELKEELLVNSYERFQDLLAEGIEPEQAARSVLGGIGDVDELIAALPKEEPRDRMYMTEQERERSAKLAALSSGLYILAGVALLIFFALAQFTHVRSLALVGMAVAATISIAPVCIQVYNANRFPQYKKHENTMVEDFKEWSNQSKKVKSLRSAISSVIWTLTVVVYLIVSFATFAWEISWIIFIIAACLEALVNLGFRLKELR